MQATFFSIKKTKTKLIRPGIKKGDIKLSVLIPFIVALVQSLSGVSGLSCLIDSTRKRRVALPKV